MFRLKIRSISRSFYLAVRRPNNGKRSQIFEVKWPTINKTEVFRATAVFSEKCIKVTGSAPSVMRQSLSYPLSRARIKWTGSSVRTATAINAIPSVTDVKTIPPPLAGAGLFPNLCNVSFNVPYRLIVRLPVNRVRSSILTAVSERITSRIFIRWFGAVNYF